MWPSLGGPAGAMSRAQVSALAALVSTPVPWADRPVGAALAALPFGYTMCFAVGAYGRSLWWADTVNGLWRLDRPTVLYESTTQSVGAASTGESVIVTYPAMPRSVLEGLSHYSLSFTASKTGSAQACTLGIREGSVGNITDVTAYSSSGVLTAAARVGSGGILRKYFASLGKTALHVASQNTPLETTVNSTNAGYPGAQSAALTDLVYWTVTQNYAVSDGTPAIERFTVIGY